jgi:hypothetical protein
VPADDQDSDQNGADQHDNPDVEPGMEGLIAGGGSQQA